MEPTARVERIIETAKWYASRRNDDYYRDYDLLLAIIGDSNGIAKRYLQEKLDIKFTDELHCYINNEPIPQKHYDNKNTDNVFKPRLHELKTHQDMFMDIITRTKTAEFRKNDRDFKKGDILLLRNYDPDKQKYRPGYILAIITHIVSEGYGIPEGYCMLSFNIVWNGPHVSPALEEEK